MKRAIIALCVVALAATPALAGFVFNGHTFDELGKVKLDYYPGHSNGGAFWVSLLQGQFAGSIYSNAAPATNVFTTYCVENGIYFTPGQQYSFSIDDWAWAGVTGSTSGSAIKATTEWIYDQWRSGNPAGYGQKDISEAIWFAQGQNGGNNNAVYKAAVAAINAQGKDAASALATHTKALNLWSLTKNAQGEVTAVLDAQSHLITVPAPAAVALTFLGAGLLRWARRKVTA